MKIKSLLLLVGLYLFTFSFLEGVSIREAAAHGAFSITTSMLLRNYFLAESKSHESVAKTDVKYVIKPFDSKNKIHRQQLSRLLTKYQNVLLDPEESASVALEKYIKVINGGRDPFLNGLRIDIAASCEDSNQILGFVAYQHKLPIESLVTLSAMMIRNNLTSVPRLDQIKRQPVSWINTIAVDPEYQKSGVGTALVKHVEEQAKLAGNELSTMTVYSHNQAMKNLAAKLGYGVMYRDTGCCFIDKKAGAVSISIYKKNL